MVPVVAHDYESTGKPLIAWDDPVAKADLVDALVSDALALLERLRGQDRQRAEATGALGLLALVAGQDVEQDDDGTWRIAQRVAPDRVISTVDPEARHMHKSRSEYRDGYKAHIAVEPETGLVTAAIVTPANVSDAKTAVDLVAAEARRTRGPGRLGLWVGRDPRRPASPKAPPGHQADSVATADSRWVLPRRLRRRSSGAGTGDVSGRASPLPSPQEATRPLAPSARAARCETAAPHHSVASRRSSIPMTTSSLLLDRQWKDGDGLAEDYRRWRPDGRALHRLARRRRQPTGPLPRRRAQPARALACEWPPSTSADWSTSDSSTTGAGSSGRPDPERASPGRQKWDLTSGTAHPGWPAPTHFHAGASVGHIPGLQHRTYA